MIESEELYSELSPAESDAARGNRATIQERIPNPVIIAIGLLVAAVAIFYIATIRDGNFWADDYALYVHHALNIVEGRAYAATGYIYNRDVPDYSPRAYPPVFPLLLAPIYWVYGLNFHAMKVEEIVFFLLSLVAVTAYWNRDLKWPYLLVFIAVLGFNPHFWSLKDSVVADIPFLLFFYLTALVAARSRREGHRWREWAVLTGILLYLCIGTRTIGLTITMGLVFYDLVKYRKLTRFVVTAVGVCFALILAQRMIIGAGEQSYADQLHPSSTTLLANVHEYMSAFVGLWGQPWGRTASITVFAVTTCLAALGMRKHLAKGLTTVEAFLVPYLVVVWLWPSPQGLRFLLPLIPFYIFLVFLGLEEFVKFAEHSKVKMVAAVPVLVIALSYATFFRYANYGAIHQTDGRPSFNDLCKFIRVNTSPADVFIFRRSRALSLFTARSAGVYSLNQPDQLSGDLDRFNAAYIVASPLFEEDRRVLIPFVHSDLSQLNEVYENSDFQVYRVHRSVDTGRDSPQTPKLSGERTTAAAPK